MSGTREKIVAAARTHFARSGYDGATIRAIARTARVDPALVLHFFGSKHELFLAAMQLPFDPSVLMGRVLDAGVDGLGARLVRTFIETWDSPEGRHLVGVIRSVVSNESAARLMREFFAHAMLGRLTASLDVDHAERRASLVASQLFGLALARYVLRLEPVASVSAAELAEQVGPTVDRYLFSG